MFNKMLYRKYNMSQRGNVKVATNFDLEPVE